jgi:hypothetical protein
MTGCKRELKNFIPLFSRHKKCISSRILETAINTTIQENKGTATRISLNILFYI